MSHCTAPGIVREIWLAPKKGDAPAAVEQAEAVAGMGLRGDRYFKKAHARDPARQCTLIAWEALEAARVEHGVDVGQGLHRRQMVVQGVDLNALVGCEFQVGPVRLRGVEWCEPCRRMARLSGQPGAIKALVHRGGLNCEILQGGVIAVGASVVVPSQAI